MTELQSDYLTANRQLTAAAEFWNGGQAELFEFAIIAHHIVGRRDGQTAQLARKIRRSEDTIERYAKGGGLWLAMLENYPSDSELLRNDLQISYWCDVGRLYSAGVIDLQSCKMWLDTALTENWTVEKLRSMLPVRKIGESPFFRAMKTIRAAIERDILNAPALESGMNDGEYRVFIKVAKWMHRFIAGKVARDEA
jgi:hypothetical protein